MEGEIPEDVDDGDDDDVLTLQQVWCVSKGKKVWLPTTQVCGGRTYVKLSKLDRGLCQLVTGRSMQRHKTKDKVTMNVEWFGQMQALRLAACQSALNRQMTENAEQSNQEPPKKFRHVRADDQYLVGDSVLVQVPDVTDQQEAQGGRQLRMLWLNKSADLWIEQTHENLVYIIDAIRASPPAQPKPRLDSYKTTFTFLTSREL